MQSAQQRIDNNKPILPGVKIFLVKLFTIKFDVTKLKKYNEHNKKFHI